MKRLLLALGALAIATSASGCSNSVDYSGEGPNLVVTSNNYYYLAMDMDGFELTGNGPEFRIWVLMNNPNVDPHEFEPSAKDRLLLANSDLVIYTGTEYDQWVDQIVETTGIDKGKLISANKSKAPYQCSTKVDQIQSLKAECEDRKTNPHLWYDLTSTELLAKQISIEFGKVQPKREKTYARALKAFEGDVKHLRELQNKVKTHIQPGSYFFGPENLSNIFLRDLGLRPIVDYSSKFANGVELSAKEMAGVKELMRTKQIKLFAANTSVPSTQASELQAYAKSQNIPIVKFSENDICDRTKLGVGGPGFYSDCFEQKIYEVGIKLHVQLPGRA